MRGYLKASLDSCDNRWQIRLKYAENMVKGLKEKLNISH